MKFTLKDYQDDAVLDVLDNLKKARKRWKKDGDRHAFSLTAPTGAGKTVMAAAAFEALFHSDDRYEFDRDPGAVVIWFSDDPSLNEQTRFRLMEASDRLQYTDLVVVQNTFNRPKFDPGKIYFLNTQKLGKKSLLVRGFEDDPDQNALPGARPDLHSHTIWDTIRNTIEDPALTLYLVLDEAHRGMGTPGKGATPEKSTIVRRLINGEKGVPGIPVVWGISATVDRFNKAMEDAEDRSILPAVTVDAGMVQESGLLKDTIALDIPDQAGGDFDTVLATRAAEMLRDASQRWSEYAAEQDNSETVTPLMVLQVPNKPKANDIGRVLDAIFKAWPELPPDSIANVFGEHRTESYSGYTVPYIEPQRVQESKWVRVLLAKDAISTGWDCPRAEVMVSFRPANDHTYIAQLLGRMVRTPLARRIPGNDMLNSVECVLPRFDRKTAKTIVDALKAGGTDSPPTGRVLINPIEVKPNPEASEAVWEKFESLPSQTRPQRAAKPAIRLTALAHELVTDGLLDGAGGKAHAAMHAFLDAFIEKRSDEFAGKRNAVTTVQGQTIFADMKTGKTTDQGFEVQADDAVVGDAFRRTARVISPDIARTYTMKRAIAMPEAEDDLDDALIDAQEEVAVLHLMENLQPLYDAEAEKLADQWFADYRNEIRKLPHDRQDAYRQIVALSNEPQNVGMARPVSRYEPTKAREKDGTEKDIAAYDKHLLCDDRGIYPAEFANEWEESVLNTEIRREGFRYWYRNPDRPSQDSLGIAYKIDGDTKIVRPDFLFFAEDEGEIVADIVDPHGFHLSDAVAKLQGLAAYAKAYGQTFRRIESVAKVDSGLRVLDITREDVRKAIDAVKPGDTAEAIYRSSVAGDYA